MTPRISIVIQARILIRRKLRVDWPLRKTILEAKHFSHISSTGDNYFSFEKKLRFPGHFDEH